MVWGPIAEDENEDQDARNISGHEGRGREAERANRVSGGRHGRRRSGLDAPLRTMA